MLDRRPLEIFLAIAEERSFVRAADRLGIAQPVVSRQLQRLEGSLGARLFHRGSRSKVTLTRAGELFHDEARDALAGLLRAEQLGRNVARGATGPLRIGYVFSGAMTALLSDMVRGLRAAFPDLEIEPRLIETPAQLRELAEGRIDVAIVRPRPSWPRGAAVLARHHEPMLLGLGTTHPLARHDSIAIGDLVSECFLTPQFDVEDELAETVRRLLRKAGGRPRIRATGDFITAAALAAAGEGVILAPASLAHLVIDGLTFRPISGHAERLELAVVGRPELPAAQREAIIAALSASRTDCRV